MELHKAAKAKILLEEIERYETLKDILIKGKLNTIIITCYEYKDRSDINTSLDKKQIKEMIKFCESTLYDKHCELDAL